MKVLILLVFSALLASATTISVIPVFVPITLHGTDVDGSVDEIGEALQATVLSRPMALSGAFPEALIEAVKTPHRLPSNDPNYTVDEVNLLILCHVKVAAELTAEKLLIELDVTELKVPAEVDLTKRQVVRLAIVAIRKTLDAYQKPQTDDLKVKISIANKDDPTDPIKDLGSEFIVEGS